MFSAISVGIVLSFCVIAGGYFIKVMVSLFQQRRKGKVAMKGVGLEPHWLFGTLEVVQLTEKAFTYLQTLLESNPKVGQLWFGPFVWYLALTHPHVIKPLLETTEPKDELGYGFLRPWIGDGLLVSKGKKWHRNRHLLTRAFHFDMLNGYTEKFNSCAATMLDKWSMMDHNLPIEIFKDVTLMTLDNMLQCTMSCNTNCQTEKQENRYIQAVFEMGEIVMKRMFNPLIHNDFIFYLLPSGRRFKSHCDYVHRFDEKIIQERKSLMCSILKNSESTKSEDDMSENLDLSIYKEFTGKNLDFLDILLLTKDEDGNGLSDREIRDEVDTFLFEGHDTTASGISWAFYCLASYPECQERCRKEVEQVIGDKDKIEREDIANLPYSTMFIKEVLRLYPPVYTIARKLSKPVTFPRGFGEDQTCLDDKPTVDSSRTFPSGASCNIPTYMLHRNPVVWKNPTVFDPLRFTPENCKDRSSYAFLPFSAGPRNCIGKNFAMTEMKVTLCKVLQRFRFFIDQECPKPEIHPTIILKALKGIHVRMELL